MIPKPKPKPDPKIDPKPKPKPDPPTPDPKPEPDPNKLLLEKQAAAKRIQSMLLEDYEKKFISALHCLIKTPRLAKRFVNIYRLIRVRAAEMESGFSKFIDEEEGSYRAVLLLLAICVGRSEKSPELIIALEKENDGSFQNWLSNQEGDIKNLKEEVDQVKSALEELNGPSLEDRLEPYSDWAREVGRFSFHWYLSNEND